MKPRDMERILRKHGWHILRGRGKGSHRVYSHPNMANRVIVPWSSRDLHVGTAEKILKDAGIVLEKKKSRGMKLEF